MNAEEEVSGREYDIVVFGSTGYTGQFVNEELYRLQTDGGRALRWAAAGRSQSKLEAGLKGEKSTPLLCIQILKVLCVLWIVQSLG